MVPAMSGRCRRLSPRQHPLLQAHCCNMLKSCQCSRQMRCPLMVSRSLIHGKHLPSMLEIGLCSAQAWSPVSGATHALSVSNHALAADGKVNAIIHATVGAIIHTFIIFNHFRSPCSCPMILPFHHNNALQTCIAVSLHFAEPICTSN